MRVFIVILVVCLAVACPAFAQFGAIIPSTAILPGETPELLRLELKLIRPMELEYLEMIRPEAFAVVVQGQRQDLLSSLREKRRQCIDPNRNFRYWAGDYQVEQSGDHSFYFISQPDWRAEQDRFLIHFSKLVVAVGVDTGGWQQPLGLELEIVPLSRPYGLWTGNLFSGQLLLRGEPLPYAEVYAGYLNQAAGIGEFVSPPAAPFSFQIIRTDAGGVFHYAMPRAGWWGFSARAAAGRSMLYDGQPKNVVLGADFWVQTRDMN